jgi:small subunit ribosomal protein S6e
MRSTSTNALQNEYAQILSKRLNEAKASHEEARKRRASSMKH